MDNAVNVKNLTQPYQMTDVQEISMNARERVREALLCRKPDKIPKALGSF